MMAPWSLGRRIALRFGVIFGALFIFPFPLYWIPKLGSFADDLGRPFTWLAVWVAQAILGLPRPVTEPSGSGDQTADYVRMLVMVVLAAVATVVWSILDRRRPGYPRLAAVAHVVLRWYLASVMLSYGFAKLTTGQFPAPLPSTLDQRIGEISPMRLIWTFMGYSAPYTMFAGLGEAVGGFLLMWRRTATLGALIVAVVMTNVVLINFCYDVPVKLYASAYLVMAILIALPSARRVIGAVLGHATAGAPERPRLSPRLERVRRVSKLAMFAILGCIVYSELGSVRKEPPHHELEGIWIVDTFTADGVTHPPLATDPERWGHVPINPRGMWLTPMIGERRWFGLKVDESAHTMTLTPEDTAHGPMTWRYAHPAPDQLVIDGVDRGHQVHATLHLQPDGLLMTRGFHWVNEQPFNK